MRSAADCAKLPPSPRSKLSGGGPLAQEQIRELLDLIAVHGFYMDLIKRALGHAIPMPQDTSEAVTNLRGRIQHSIDVLRRWLALLDMAISPPMVRDGLKGATTLETAEALLRYYINKTSRADHDRDKADFVVTYLYRTTAAAMAGSGDEMTLRFERAIRNILLAHQIRELPEEHRRLVEEFGFIQQEVEDFHHFDDLMDAGIVQRVREIKQSLHESFYHPQSLATVAAYNVFFGNRFDELFRSAAQQIKEFANKVQQQGGSTLSRVDGDVTVKNLQDIGEDQHALKLEYGKAQEHFRKVSKMKKAVDKKAGGRAAVAVAATHVSPVTPRVVAPGVASTSSVHAAPVAAALASAPIEESKITGAQETIRNFTRTVTKPGPVIVPMPHGNVVLSPAEAEAYKAEYRDEKSFRADFANCLVRMVAVQTRMAAELKDYNAKRTSSYLWKPHADALAYLMSVANREIDNAGRLMGLAQDRGLAEKVTGMRASADKMRTQTHQIAATLQQQL
jgi:hypothetical protein